MFRWFLDQPLRIGSEAPDFRLPAGDGQLVSLSSLRGQNVVLIFYPGDDTTVCRQQLCQFRDHWALAQEKNTLVFGVNPQNAGSHEKFRANRSLPFPLLVDEGGNVARAYHAGGRIVRRTVYLIGRSGRIRFARRGVPSPEEVLAAAE
jgi:peroxiredoxin Q/BCP